MQNAFSEKLCMFSFSVFAMLIVDLLHKFELGVWRAILTHLLHILNSLKGHKLHELDRRKVIQLQCRSCQSTDILPVCRYHQVPTFRWDTIQCFSMNASEMKRLAAHDFEDLLQVCNGSVAASKRMTELSSTVCSSCVRRFAARPP